MTKKALITDYEKYVKRDDRYLRPAEVDLLIGDATKARRELGWQPEYTFAGLVSEIMQADLAAIRGSARRSVLQHS